jgi:putative pyruvate formate lyase activating enzyme
MHAFFRPDSLRAFEDEGVKRALGRYIEVSRDLKAAKFLISKSVKEKREIRTLEGAKPEDLKFAEVSYLDSKIELAREVLKSCSFCERRCGVNRAKGEKGFCNLGAGARLSSEFIHLGEEACLVPSHTLFFIGCTFYCVYCQNWTISRHVEKGTPVTGKELAEAVKRRRLIDRSRNVNLVGGEPTPNLHVILEMLKHLDVNIPVVWNSNMYMSEESMELLDGCVDVYLADFKYGNDDCALRLSKVRNYWHVVTRNHLLAKKQAELLIRHLVLPNHVECCTRRVLEWIASNLGNDVRVNIMAQYRPEFQAYKAAGIDRHVTSAEMSRAFEIAKEAGLTNLD